MKRFSIFVIGLCVIAFNQTQGMENEQSVPPRPIPTKSIFNEARANQDVFNYRAGILYDNSLGINEFDPYTDPYLSDEQRAKFIEMEQKNRAKNHENK